MKGAGSIRSASACALVIAEKAPSNFSGLIDSVMLQCHVERLRRCLHVRREDRWFRRDLLEIPEFGYTRDLRDDFLEELQRFP